MTNLETIFTSLHTNFYSSNLGTVDQITFGHDEFFFRKQRVLGTEIIEPSQKVSSRGECTLYTDIYNQEIRRPLPHPQKTFVACMSKISDYREGGDGTVPDSSGSALDGEGMLKTSKMKEYDHQSVYKKHEARNFVITAVRNLALKRIEEGIQEGGVGNAK